MNVLVPLAVILYLASFVILICWLVRPHDASTQRLPWGIPFRSTSSLYRGLTPSHINCKPKTHAAWEWHNAAHLYESHWLSPQQGRGLLLLVRVALAVHFALGVLAQALLPETLASTSSSSVEFCMILMSDWLFAGVGAYAILATAVSVRGIRAAAKGEDDVRPYGRLSKAFAIVASSVPCSLILLTAADWLAPHGPGVLALRSPSWKRSGSVALLSLEMLLNRVPVTTSWVLFPLLYSTSFLASSWINWGSSDGIAAYTQGSLMPAFLWQLTLWLPPTMLLAYAATGVLVLLRDRVALLLRRRLNSIASEGRLTTEASMSSPLLECQRPDASWLQTCKPEAPLTRNRASTRATYNGSGDLPTAAELLQQPQLLAHPRLEPILTRKASVSEPRKAVASGGEDATGLMAPRTDPSRIPGDPAALPPVPPTHPFVHRKLFASFRDGGQRVPSPAPTARAGPEQPSPSRSSRKLTKSQSMLDSGRAHTRSFRDFVPPRVTHHEHPETRHLDLLFSRNRSLSVSSASRNSLLNNDRTYVPLPQSGPARMHSLQLAPPPTTHASTKIQAWTSSHPQKQKQCYGVESERGRGSGVRHGRAHSHGKLPQPERIQMSSLSRSLGRSFSCNANAAVAVA